MRISSNVMFYSQDITFFQKNVVINRFSYTIIIYYSHGSLTPHPHEVGNEILFWKTCWNQHLKLLMSEIFEDVYLYKLDAIPVMFNGTDCFPYNKCFIASSQLKWVYKINMIEFDISWWIIFMSSWLIRDED